MKIASMALALALSASLASAQRPHIVNGQVTTVAAAGDLGAQIRGAHTRWIGYAVPEIEGSRVMCCFESYGNVHSGGRCDLGEDGSNFTNDDGDELHLASPMFAVVYRVNSGVIERVRAYSLDCTLSASGMAVTWIDGVDPRASVALLASIVRAGDRRSEAMSALALHADPSAEGELERILGTSSLPDELRGQAAFWLASARGRRGYEAVVAEARSQSAPSRLREKTIFALTQSREAGAIDEIIRLAKDDPDSRVRGQAIFWLSQKAGRKAAGAIREAIDRDPEAQVRVKAVFAVSQLPNDQSIPILVDLMKHHRDPEVRKKAAFWLGQKNDPRALAALEDVLKE